MYEPMTLRYLTAGESHGPGLTAILEGLPANLEICREGIDHELKRRQKGYGRGGRMKIESDAVQITGGIRHGKTLGSPVALWIENKDFRAWGEEMSPDFIEGFVSKKSVEKPRPGHADLYGGIKYNQRDLRHVLERASARETAARVAVGVICRQFLKNFGVRVTGHVINIGGESIFSDRPDFDTIQRQQENDPCRCIDPKTSQKMREKIDVAKTSGNTVGGVFEIIFTGVPVGLGSHVHWDRKLDARLAASMLSIQAIKGCEIGMGFETANRFGSDVHDPIQYDAKNKSFHHTRNNAGGITGGMTTGEDIVVRGVMKPISTLYTPLPSVNIDSKEPSEASIERSDTCAVPAASVIAENVLCFEIANAFLEKFGGDSMEEVRRNFESYQNFVRGY